ncbi:MAG: histidine--tRNA ligase [Treponema sp.]|nr:histidine--tRNA ligase [Treponema sp.]
MENLIQPRILKGFRDFLPESEITRSNLIEKITKVYRSYGYVPIDTPVLEYTDILLRKSNGETEKQVFRFEDNGGRDVAMRFDLTVPFARFTAEHFSELYMPFKRYHIAKVWRGEKPQAGRYREFVQCDIDTVGSDSATCDFEILSVLKAALDEIVGKSENGKKKFVIKVNHRGLINLFFKNLGVEDKIDEILPVLDAIKKVPEDVTKTKLTEIFDVSSSKASDTASCYAKTMEFIGNDGTVAFLDLIDRNEKLAGEGASVYCDRLREIYKMMQVSGIETSFEFDPLIMRGLDYYTGIVFETTLFDDNGDEVKIGSVCSGGRYDNLTGLYMKEKVSGVGGSIGLDRLIAGLEMLGKLEKKGSYLDVEIFNQNGEDVVAYHKVAAELRSLGIAVEVFPEPKKMNQQYKVTEAKAVKWGVLMNAEDISKGTFTLKNLQTREQFVGVNAAAAAELIKK